MVCLMLIVLMKLLWLPFIDDFDDNYSGLGESSAAANESHLERGLIFGSFP